MEEVILWEKTKKQRKTYFYRRDDGFYVFLWSCVCFAIAIPIILACFYASSYIFIEIDIDRPNDNLRDKINNLGQASEELDLRLPTNLIPISYFLKLQPFIDDDPHYPFYGYEQMKFFVSEPTDQIIFHGNNISIAEESLELFPSVAINSVEYNETQQFFIITVNSSLTQGTNYTLSMNYTGYLTDNLYGFYRSTYANEDGDEVLLATTHFESTNARRAFLCFDEPALKATYEIHILREGARRRSISNMPRLQTYEAEAQWKGWYWDIFDVSVPMSSYLVAFVVSDFSYVTSDALDHVTFRVWVREQALDQTAYALEKGPQVLEFYEQYFNIPFPLPKQDMIALPDFGPGAMENWGLVTYRETALLYNEELGSASNKQRVGIVIAHELAHQWFGDLVSPAWWTYTWLNEGFAAFMESTGLDAVEKDFKMLDQFILYNNFPAFDIDCLESSHPITVNVSTPEEISEIFDDISYNKGASIIRMMELFLTNDTFRAGLTNYLNELAYSSATQDDLWNYLTIQAHKDGTLPDDISVKDIMDTWTLQMGYPIITVSRSNDGQTFNLTQERFLLRKNENSTDDHEYKWWVPISYATQINPNLFENTYPTIWMKENEKSIEFEIEDVNNNTWVIFNNQLGGYYRVNYEKKDWNLIIQQLNNDASIINLLNRAQILDDSLNLARAGLISYDIALDTNAYLEFEAEYVPWDASLRSLSYLEEMFTREDGYTAMKDYLLTLLEPLYEITGFKDNLNDPHLDQLKRALALSWTCHLEYEDCVNNSVNLYSQWIQHPDNLTIISPNLKSTVYCTGIAFGGSYEWFFAYNQSITTNLGTERDYLLSAMGCSKNASILNYYLSITFTEEYGIRKQDASRAFDSVAENDIGRDLAWQYLQDNWDDIAAYYGSYSSVADFTEVVTREFNTEEELAEVVALKKEHEDDLGEATQSVDQAIENVENNIDWMNKYYSEINQYLIDHNYGKSRKN